MPWVHKLRTYGDTLIISFNPCFWWKYCPGPTGSDAISSPYSLFQSLFWWKYCPGIGKRFPCARPHTQVSILVLVEVLPWGISRPWKLWTWRGFNPCSGGSIALGPAKALAHHRVNQCFNPCSGGSIALGASIYSSATSKDSSFNPCSGGSIALGSLNPHPLKRLEYRFNPCSWWKYCPGSGRRSGPGMCIRVSILVLVEVLPWARRSLFRVLPLLSFNPCSGGSIALGVQNDLQRKERQGFNPCSGGSIALGLCQDPDRTLKLCVSILVLVEVLPWEGRCCT